VQSNEIETVTPYRPARSSAARRTIQSIAGCAGSMRTSAAWGWAVRGWRRWPACAGYQWARLPATCSSGGRSC